MTLYDNASTYIDHFWANLGNVAKIYKHYYCFVNNLNLWVTLCHNKSICLNVSRNTNNFRNTRQENIKRY